MRDDSMKGMLNRKRNMNLNRVPDRAAEQIQLLVENEIKTIADATVVEGIRSFLIVPRLEMRTWDWHAPRTQYPVWMVAESSRYDYGIAFSDYGFAPEHPWGLVFVSHSNFDADYCWYSTLEQAYRESRLIEEFTENRGA
jgi:hypothetical protein